MSAIHDVHSVWNYSHSSLCCASVVTTGGGWNTASKELYACLEPTFSLTFMPQGFYLPASCINFPPKADIKSDTLTDSALSCKSKGLRFGALASFSVSLLKIVGITTNIFLYIVDWKLPFNDFGFPRNVLSSRFMEESGGTKGIGAAVQTQVKDRREAISYSRTQLHRMFMVSECG